MRALGPLHRPISQILLVLLLTIGISTGVSPPPSGARSNDAVEWTAAIPVIPGIGFFAVAADPGQPNRLYAAGGTGSAANIYASQDRGESWTAVKTSVVYDEVKRRHALAPDPLLMVSSLAVSLNGTVFLSDRGRILKSTDGGISWRATYQDGSVKVVVADPSDPATVYAVQGGGSRGFVLKSSDAGETWDRVELPIPCDPGKLAINAEDPATLYVGGGCGLLRSEDGGASWSPLSTPPSTILQITTNPARTGQVFVGTTPAPNGLWISNDYGDTWTQRSEPAHRIDWILPDPRDPSGRMLFVAGRSPQPAEDLYWSADGGQTWRVLGLPPGTTLGSSLSVQPRAMLIMGERLIVGTNSGLWSTPLPPVP
jgi:photosystem II stability/assembly factor-like uncharacterized protein